MSRLVVRQHSPHRQGLIWGLLAISVILGFWGLFEYGRYSAGFDSLSAREEIYQLEDRIAQLKQEKSQLSGQKTALERSGQIEKQAYEEVRQALKTLQDENLELKEELTFYRGIVSPNETAQGLRIQRFHVAKNAEEGSYHYKLILTQVLKNDRLARGSIDVRIEGIQEEDGRQMQFALKDLSEEKKLDLEYRFKYFQAFEGNMRMPSGFVPIRVTVSVDPRSRQHKAIQKTFDWTVGSLTDLGEI